MCDFHYGRMLTRYGYEYNNLCFTDTDSLLYEVLTNDIYADMSENTDSYDFSDYPYNRYLYSQFKDELNGVVMEEFIGAGPKC